MVNWLNHYLTAGVYLALAAMFTALLLILWFARSRKDASGLTSLKLCASTVLALWTAVAFRNEWEVAEPGTLYIALAVFAGSLGLFTLFPKACNALAMGKRKRMARACVGQPATVYRAIEAGEQGSVEVKIGEKRLHLPALSESGMMLPAFCEVQVRATNETGVLLVAIRKS